MAYTIGDTKYLVVTPNGALDANPVSALSSDPSIVLVTATDNPLKFKLDFLAAGDASLSVSATSSDGSALSASLLISIVPPAATTIALSIEDSL